MIRLDSFSKEELIRKYRELEKQNEALRRELRKYKNSNTPPSAHPHLRPSAVSLKRNKRRGAPLNHPGATRPWTLPGRPLHIEASECPRCQSSDIRVIGVRRQRLEDVPPDIKLCVVEVRRDVCKCNSCSLEFQAKDGRTPVQGRFGVQLMVLVIFLRFLLRGVLRKTAGFLEEGFACRIAPASVQAIISRAAMAAQVEYAGLKERIAVARIVYVDETSFSVLGCNWWVWVFRTDTDILLVVRHSRSSAVLAEILGESYSGIVVCDGFRAYDFLASASIQRCWAHLLRKSAELEDSAVGRHFHSKLSALFNRIKRFNQKPRTRIQREREYQRVTTRLERLVRYYGKYPQCQSVVKYISFHSGEWLTCVRFDGVEPTNNYAEQAIRETVIVRKIIGAFRSQSGTKVYETLASLLATWQFQGLDTRKELERMLTAGMC